MRTLLSDNGVITDITAKVADYNNYLVTPGIVAAEDYIYLATEYPFTHQFIELGTVNALASTLSVQIWNNSTWENAVDLIDYTSLLTGKTFEQSEMITFRPAWDKGWTAQQYSVDVTGVESLDIYDMYWARLKFSANLTAGMTIKHIGVRFSKDSDLFLFYPDLANVNLMGAFKAGKTNWNEQHYMAAEAIIRRMKAGRIIINKSQLMDWSILREAACHKVAEIAYRGMGPSMEKQMLTARDSFETAYNIKYFMVDGSGDGILDSIEARQTTMEMTR